jgi:hypothetical protein
MEAVSNAYLGNSRDRTRPAILEFKLPPCDEAPELPTTPTEAEAEVRIGVRIIIRISIAPIRVSISPIGITIAAAMIAMTIAPSVIAP